MQRQMLYGGVICYNETGLCQHFSLVLTFSGGELERCVIARPSAEELAAAARPPGPAESNKTWTGWEKRQVVETSGRRWATKTPEHKVA